jgi:hypothetical protein
MHDLMLVYKSEDDNDESHDGEGAEEDGNFNFYELDIRGIVNHRPNPESKSVEYKLKLRKHCSRSNGSQYFWAQEENVPDKAIADYKQRLALRAAASRRSTTGQPENKTAAATKSSSAEGSTEKPMKSAEESPLSLVDAANAAAEAVPEAAPEDANATDATECAICMSTPVDSVTTPCDHTFCGECLGYWLNQQESGMSCPQCRSSLRSFARKIAFTDTLPAAWCEPVVQDAIEVGTLVEANFGQYGAYYPGRITSVNSNGTYSIDYDDGDKEARVPRHCVRLRPLEAASRSG